jgi:hypothetical protein
MARNTKGQPAQKAEPKFPTDAELREQGFTTLSSRIRQLASLGMSKGDISRSVVRENGEHPRYQHVRNVLNTPLKTPQASEPAAASEGTANA